MTLKECYSVLEADYEGTIGRLMNERLVQRFILKFLNDTSYEQLENFMKAEDWKEAFRMAHTMKGVCQNLGLTKLFVVCDELTEALRPCEKPENSEQLLNAVTEEYVRTVGAIKSFEETVNRN